MAEQDNLSREEANPEEQEAAAGTDAPGPAAEDAPQAEGGAAGSPEEMSLLLEDARAKADEHWNQCLRLQAEVDNLRKRNQRDLENAHRYALEKFAGELLPVRDSLEMGLAAAEGENVDPEKLREGTDLTLKMLSGAMDKFGITEVDPAGERFNPEFHQAMSMQPRDDVEPNTVVTVVQKGYLLNDRLLRPAMVIVSQAGQGGGGSGGNIDDQA